MLPIPRLPVGDHDRTMLLEYYRQGELRDRMFGWSYIHAFTGLGVSDHVTFTGSSFLTSDRVIWALICTDTMAYQWNQALDLPFRDLCIIRFLGHSFDFMRTTASSTCAWMARRSAWLCAQVSYGFLHSFKPYPLIPLSNPKIPKPFSSPLSSCSPVKISPKKQSGK